MASTGQNGSGEAERAGITVVVPTTAGAILVRGLRWTQKIPTSRVVLGNETADQCERWTKDYNNLLRPGDPMRTLLGLPDGGGFRLVVTSEIDQGKSWIMPVAAAHLVAAMGEALHDDIPRARLVVWSTGALDFSLADSAAAVSVVPNDYQLVSKIDLSRDLFAAAAHAGTPVLCILPAGPDAERTSTILGKVLANQRHHITIAGSLADLVGPLDSFLRGEDFSAMAARRTALVPFVKPDSKTYAGAQEPPEAVAEPQMSSTQARGLAGDRPHYAATQSGMDMRKIGIAAAALLTLVGTASGAYLLLRKPTGSDQLATPSPINPNPAPSQPVLPQPGPVTAVSPTVPQPSAPPVIPATPPVTAGETVARLTLLVAPAGSSCRAQAYEIQPRFGETMVELSSNAPAMEIDANGLCGLAVSGTGSIRARFLQSSVTGVVGSLSGPARIIFNPALSSDALPVVALEGAGIARIMLKRR